MKNKVPRRPFYFVRHGQTDANAQGLMCGGDWDIPLNSHGIEQAKSRSLGIANLVPQISHVFASPMKRAQETAKLLTQHLLIDIQTVEGLREWRVGEWEKRPWGEVPNPFETKEDPSGGETRSHFEARIEAAVSAVLAQTDGVPLLVSHGAAAHALFTVLDVDKKQIENCTIYFVQPIGSTWTLNQV
jgi:broad specificity phosphatase PhoE